MHPHSLRTAAFATLTLLLLRPVAAHADESKEAWTHHCAKCHGPDGRGDTRIGRKQRIKNLVAPEQQAKMSDAAILQTIAEGARDPDGEEKMPPFKGKLSEQQRASLVGYVRSLKRDPSATADGSQ